MTEVLIPVLQKCAMMIYDLLKSTSLEYVNTKNISGDIQLGADIQADQIIEKELIGLDVIHGICSEEKSNAILKQNGSLLVAYDPLDGSSIIGANLSVGSIFGIYEKEFQANTLIASAYVVYGPRLELIFVNEKKSYYFVENNAKWEEKSFPMLKNKGLINAPGGTQKNWEIRHKELINTIFKEGYRLRYSGGMVPDLHQILIKGGGLFSYPATLDAPKGKLRKLFEVLPFAFIFEKAGGEAIDGKQRLLDIEVNDLHETTPCFLGSKEEIKKVREFYE